MSGRPRVALAGFGSVGRYLAERIDAGALPEVDLVAVTARDLDRARSNVGRLTRISPRVLPLAELIEQSDIVVECATADAFPEIARGVLECGRLLLALSAGGVPAFPDILDVAARHRGRIRIASGALPGLDSIRCAAEGSIRSVKLNSRIKPGTFVGEPYFDGSGIDFTGLTAPLHVFSGTAREAAAAFPRHFNVAISLSLAGIGFDRTMVEIWADPHIPGAIHNVELEAEEVVLSMTTRNRPSEANPKTSRIIAPSVLAALRSMVSTLHVGS